MTAGISLIPEKTGAHRAPLQPASVRLPKVFPRPAKLGGALVLYLSLLLLLFSPTAFAQTKITRVTWSFAGPSGSSDRIVALAVDPRSDSVFYAAAPGGGVWKTQDGGSSWSPLFDSQASLQVCSLAIDPRFPDVIYAGTGDGQSPRPFQGVVRSGDGGHSWTTGPRITDRPVCTLAVDPTNSSRIFAGSEEGLFLSSDSGASWAPVL